MCESKSWSQCFNSNDYNTLFKIHSGGYGGYGHNQGGFGGYGGS